MRTVALAVLCGIVLSACGPKGGVDFTTLPTTVEGMFAVSVEKGPVDANGISEANFGTINVNGKEHLVQVTGAVLAASGVPRIGGKVKATLASRTDEYGAPTYIVSAMQKL